ncbi:hypothetical protein GCM10009535_53670 [Streptomyces thermocarboxydovorans]|uniref:Transposase n=1 Tax=Streptomyces thermocarboxydovorans TaxID=59298 RepID=A0ABN1HUB5_9ACTN
MRQEWEPEDLIEVWTLLEDDMKRLRNKSGANRLGFALLLKFFEVEARFPESAGEIPEPAVSYVAQQVKVPAGEWASYDWAGRAITRHRSEIRAAYEFRESTEEDQAALAEWLSAELCPVELSRERLVAAVVARCRNDRIEPPAPAKVDRLVGRAIRAFEERFCRTTMERLPRATRDRLDELISGEESADGEGEADVVGGGRSFRDVHYAAIRQPQDPEVFITALQGRLRASLDRLETALVQDTTGGVSITRRHGEPWIKVSPQPKLEEPENLVAVKAEMERRWGTIDLLDIIKEAEFDTGFTGEFTSVATSERLPREVLRRRLLLVLFALGTNMGIKRVVATGKHGESEAVLRRVRHLFVNRDNLRAAVTKLVNATLAARDEAWWGTGTACASDSRKFGAWSSNFMTEWHQRYRGPGVMIYWHVERKSVCIYSQLKSCSASEVASMIEGVLRHCTEMVVDRQYTDTHGASIVGFAFAHMLDFKLMPRLKNIGSSRLYRPAAG